MTHPTKNTIQRYPTNLEIMATSTASSCVVDTGESTMASSVTIRGDCYDIGDMYRNCLKRKQTSTPLCSAVVQSYLRCSESDK